MTLPTKEALAPKMTLPTKEALPEEVALANRAPPNEAISETDIVSYLLYCVQF